jgi:hypothetical protein
VKIALDKLIPFYKRHLAMKQQGAPQAEPGTVKSSLETA